MSSDQLPTPRWERLTKEEIQNVFKTFAEAPAPELTSLDAAIEYTKTGNDDLLWDLHKSDPEVSAASSPQLRTYDEAAALDISRGGAIPKRKPVDKKAMYQKFLAMPSPEPNLERSVIGYCHFGIVDEIAGRPEDREDHRPVDSQSDLVKASHHHPDDFSNIPVPAEAEFATVYGKECADAVRSFQAALQSTDPSDLIGANPL